MDELIEKNKVYAIDDDIAQLASDVCEKRGIVLGPARLKYVKVFPHISKNVAGRCIISNPMVKLFGECDFIIQMSGDLWDKLDDGRKRILLEHELLHVGCTQNKNGEWKYYIVRHNIEDFRIILEKYGFNWLNELKTIQSSILDVEEIELDGFSA